MANQGLFGTLLRGILPRTNTLNAAGAPAYALDERHALAQLAATGCLNGTFYASAEAQLEHVLRAAEGVDTHFLAQCAVYARRVGLMKDMPALLTALLTVRDGELLELVFPRVVDNGRMLRSFVQIVRSGRLGRRSLGTRPRRLVRQWLEARSDEQLLGDSVGAAPSLADVIKMVHPKPATPSREALYGWLIGRDVAPEALPESVRALDDFRAGRDRSQLPAVPWQLVTSLPLSAEHWRTIARTASWQAVRMNLNTFLRHGVFDDAEATSAVVARLRDADAIERARVFPYQLLATWKSVAPGVPHAVRDALQDALEFSLRNVPALPGRVVLCPDVSGSMASPVTGTRDSASSAVRCIDVAALITAALLRRSPGAEVLPFAEDVRPIALNPRDTVLTNAERLAALGGGGTACAAPLRRLNRDAVRGDLVVYVSDNQSWLDARAAGETAMLHEWARFKRRNPSAVLVCIDIQPYADSQVVPREDIICVGGFSDAVFLLLEAVTRGGATPNHWVAEIAATAL